jgi:hypothetical protein
LSDRTPVALAFADRHVLSLGERLLARAADDALRGHILRIATVYVIERGPSERRAIEVAFAFDALAADLPSVKPYTIPADAETSLKGYLQDIAPRVELETGARDTHPLRSPLRIVVNALLYATSAGVEPETRTPRRAARKRSSAEVLESESVFYLPGKIDIRRVRQLQALARVESGRAMLARFMVRGHWRRAAKGWSNQRLRWIEAYWKAPDMGAVVKKAYRMKE